MRRVVACALFVTCAGSLGVLTPAPAVADATRVPVAKLSTMHTDVEVFMQVHATPRQVRAVERQIRSSSQVARYAHLDRRTAYREFRRIFRHNQELVDATRASDLPESFRVELRGSGDAKVFASRMRVLAGVDSAERPGQVPSETELLSTIRHCQLRGDIDLEVFMRLDATPADVDVVVASVATQPDLSVTRILDHDDAYAEFRQIFSGDPGLVKSLQPADLPMSIRVHSNGEVTDAVVDGLAALPGVDSVESPREVCTAIREELDRGVTPDQLAKLLHAQAVGTRT